MRKGTAYLSAPDWQAAESRRDASLAYSLPASLWPGIPLAVFHRAVDTQDGRWTWPDLQAFRGHGGSAGQAEIAEL